MAVSKTLLVFSVPCLLLAFLLYTPVPSGIAEPLLQMTYIAGFRLIWWMAVVMETFTSTLPLDTIKQQAESWYIPEPREREGLGIKNMVFDGVPVRVYTPVSLTESDLVIPPPCVVYFIGGGWSIFTLDSYDTVMRDLALGSQAVVVSVRYRQGPVHPFPFPFDDCVQATRHILLHPEKIKINPHRVAVAGDDSGGNLAAAVALRLSEEDPNHTPPLKLQVLIQPPLQVTAFETPAYTQNAYNTILTRDLMLHAWLLYLGHSPTHNLTSAVLSGRHISTSLQYLHSLYLHHEKLSDYVTVYTSRKPLSGEFDREVAAFFDHQASNPFISPLTADSLSAVPPSLIIVGEFDVLRDDGIWYAARLKDAGVKVKVIYVEDQGHGFMAPRVKDSTFTFDKSAEVWADVYLYIKSNL